jgi:hypothetical protein
MSKIAKIEDRDLPASLQMRDVPVDQALAALASQFQELAASMFPLADVECVLQIDMAAGKAHLSFRAYR